MSNYPPPGTPPPGYPPAGYPPPGYAVQPQPSGCGCGGCLGKFLILLGVVFLLLILACGGLIYKTIRSVQDSMVRQPVEVQAMADEITPLRVPAALQPIGGGRAKMPFTGALLGEGAAFAGQDRTNFLFIGSFGSVVGPQVKDQLIQALESGQFDNGPANQKGGERREELKDAKTSTIERTIRGGKAVFEISEGVGVKSGKKKIRLEGAFQGKIGPSMIMLEADEAVVSRGDVDDMIESIVDAGQEDK